MSLVTPSGSIFLECKTHSNSHSQRIALSLSHTLSLFLFFVVYLSISLCFSFFITCFLSLSLCFSLSLTLYQIGSSSLSHSVSSSVVAMGGAMHTHDASGTFLTTHCCATSFSMPLMRLSMRRRHTISGSQPFPLMSVSSTNRTKLLCLSALVLCLSSTSIRHSRLQTIVCLLTRPESTLTTMTHNSYYSADAVLIIRYRVVLSTDESDYGGHARVTSGAAVDHFTTNESWCGRQHHFYAYLPARSAVVFAVE